MAPGRRFAAKRGDVARGARTGSTIPKASTAERYWGISRTEEWDAARIAVRRAFAPGEPFTAAKAMAAIGAALPDATRWARHRRWYAIRGYNIETGALRVLGFDRVAWKQKEKA
jgi:hypothetical protein